MVKVVDALVQEDGISSGTPTMRFQSQLEAAQFALLDGGQFVDEAAGPEQRQDVTRPAASITKLFAVVAASASAA